MPHDRLQEESARFVEGDGLPERERDLLRGGSAAVLSAALTFAGFTGFAGFTAALEADTLVPPSAVWAYDDTGTDLGSGWKAPAFDDGAWPRGPAKLGFGEGDELTPLEPRIGEEGKNYTFYFRHRFLVARAGVYGGLAVRLVLDDGCVAYLNGTELLRSNLPPGPVDYRTLALQSVGGPEEGSSQDFSAGSSALVSGENVLAVEVHQASPVSGDLSFALELRGVESVGPACGVGRLVGHWRLDEGNGLVARDSAGGQDGILQNMGAGAWRPGFVGGALELDGVDDAVVVAGASCFDFLRSFTWAAWIRTASAGANGVILSRSTASLEWGPGAKALHLGYAGGRNDGRLSFAAGDAGIVGSMRRVDDGEWHHVAIAVELSPRFAPTKATLYIDGKADGTASDMQIATEPDAGPLRMGSGGPGFARGPSHFRGLLDEVRIYGTALQEAEVLDLANGVEEREQPFRRGDASSDGRRDLSDAVFTLSHLFTGGPPLSCLKAGDSDDSGVLDLSDAVYLLLHLFQGGSPPAEPFEECGLDPSADELPCESFPPCG